MSFIFGALIFALFVDYIMLRQKTGKWPKVRNPFYVEEDSADPRFI